MSSTNRSNKRDNHRDDYYVTPKWCVREFLRTWDIRSQLPDNPIILDPCAGGDAVNSMTYPSVLKEWGYDTVSMDIRSDSPAEFSGIDFLSADLYGVQPDLIITNPPYVIAKDCVVKSLEVAKPGGWVVMLLRINFLGAQNRAPFWQEFMPHSLYTHSKRPGFYPDNWKDLYPDLDKKGTDSTEYSHFVWQVGNYGDFYRGFVIKHDKDISDAIGPYQKGEDDV
jgi:hypothetical protein